MSGSHQAARVPPGNAVLHILRTFRELLLSGFSWNLLSAVALQGSVPGSSFGSLGELGLQIERGGTYKLDASALADALRSVPGIDVQRAGRLGKITDVRLRGADPRHTLVLFDGGEERERLVNVIRRRSIEDRIATLVS